MSQAKSCPIDKHTVERLVEEVGTPLQIYDGWQIELRVREFLETARTHFPNFENFFAVKALPNPHILKLITDQGFGLDCSSVTELDLARSIGLPGNRIVFSANYLSEEDYYRALDQGVNIDLDDYEILKRVNRFPNKISFRINPAFVEDSLSTDVISNMLSGKNSKFGVPEDDMMKAYMIAKSAGVQEFGIHIMCGSNMTDESYWTFLAEKTCLFIRQIKNSLNIDISEVNFGGGIGIPYKPDDRELNINTIFENIKQVFDSSDTSLSQNPDTVDIQYPKIVMESGRYITGPFGWLVTRCDSIKHANHSWYYGVDACMSNLMRPGMYGAYHHIEVLNNSQIYEEANVVGKLCENNDWFAKNRILKKAEIGDLLVIFDTGAHSHSMGFQYNGRLRAPELLLTRKGEFELIRRRETVDDYTSTVAKI